MFRHTEKQFTNDATTPMIVSVAACIDDNGIVRDMHATGGIASQNEIQRAESHRMHDWIRMTFVGQHEFFFNAHNGKVPAPSFAEPERRYRVINTINVVDPSKTAEAMMSHPDLIQRLIGAGRKTQTTVGAASSPKEARSVVVGHPGYEFAPRPLSYWQDRNRPKRFFVVVSTHECENHSHVRLLRVDNQRGGEYDFMFTTVDEWEKMFSPTTADKVPGLTPYGSMAAELYGTAHSPARERVTGMPRELGAGYGLEEFFREFIEGVPFDGTEQPPAPGEQYHSMISDKVYTVVDTTRKLHHESEYFVTMQRDEDGHRTKFTYRDHATWLSVWRPLDPDGKKHVKVEVVLDASDALRQFGEAAHEAAEALAESDAVFDLVRIVDELHRRLPGWNELPNTVDHTGYNETDKIIRAIRTLFRQRNNASEDLRTAKAELSKLSDKNRELSSMLGVRTREIDALKQERGGAWDAARVRREQDTMRELLRHYSLLFIRHHGRAKMKDFLAELDAETLLGLPQEHFMLLVTKCEKHSGEAS